MLFKFPWIPGEDSPTPTLPKVWEMLLLCILTVVSGPELFAANDATSPLGAKRYSIDPPRSFVSFSIGFMKIRSTKGAFHDYRGTIMWSNDPARSSVTAVIRAESIFTGVMARDRHLRSSDFFDVKRFPYIIFQSRSVHHSGEGWRVIGDLTMHGVTHPQEILFQPQQPSGDRPSQDRLSFVGNTHLRRRDFGIIGNFWGNKVLSDRVDIQLHIEATEVESGAFGGPMHGKRKLTRELLPSIMANGAGTLSDRYHRLRLQAPQEYDFSEFALMELAVALRKKSRLADAIGVTRFNLSLFPGHLPSLDLLGYLQLLSGDRGASMATYRRLLRLDPHHSGALEMLRRLEGES